MTSSITGLLGSSDAHTGKSWLDVESEPKVFQDIVQKLGAKEVNVQEVYGLDGETFTMLHGSVQGLIFLFNYRGVDGEETKEIGNCPDHIWFANQTTNNACATVALLNILLNLPGLRLETHGTTDLAAFRASTVHLTPVERGLKLAESVEIRQVHNSLGRDVEALNAALSLKNDFDAWKKSRCRGGAKKVANKRQSGSKKKPTLADDNAFHYIAYVPVRGEVWRLDGLMLQPTNLGPYEYDWTSLARENILQRIKAEQELSFNVMALCVSELQSLLQRSLKIAVALNRINTVSAMADSERGAAHSAPNVVSEIDKSMPVTDIHAIFGFTGDDLARHGDLAEDILAQFRANPSTRLVEELVTEQKDLKNAYLQYRSQNRPSDAAAAEKSQDDNTDATYEIMKTLIEHGLLEKYLVR